jgi:hypothetical protein
MTVAIGITTLAEAAAVGYCLSVATVVPLVAVDLRATVSLPLVAVARRRDGAVVG